MHYRQPSCARRASRAPRHPLRFHRWFYPGVLAICGPHRAAVRKRLVGYHLPPPNGTVCPRSLPDKFLNMAAARLYHTLQYVRGSELECLERRYKEEAPMAERMRARLRWLGRAMKDGLEHFDDSVRGPSRTKSKNCGTSWVAAKSCSRISGTSARVCATERTT